MTVWQQSCLRTAEKSVEDALARLNAGVESNTHPDAYAAAWGARLMLEWALIDLKYAMKPESEVEDGTHIKVA
jgi:hypothetical protein